MAEYYYYCNRIKKFVDDITRIEEKKMGCKLFCDECEYFELIDPAMSYKKINIKNIKK